jgi:hypothetical protein
VITRTSFRVLVVGSVGCMLFALLLSFLTESLLPAEHQLYLQRRAAETGERDLAMLSLGIPVLVLGLVSALGLFRLWAWARVLAVIVTAAFVALTPLVGVIVDSGWVGMFSEISTLLWGAVLAAAYWSPVSAHFASESKAT